jgi:hypothetical protein
MTGATMARTPVIAAHLLPLIEPLAPAGVAPDSQTNHCCNRPEPAAGNNNDNDNDNDNDLTASVIVSISSESEPETSDSQAQSASACTPVADRRLAWA